MPESEWYLGRKAPTMWVLGLFGAAIKLGASGLWVLGLGCRIQGLGFGV